MIVERIQGYIGTADPKALSAFLAIARGYATPFDESIMRQLRVAVAEFEIKERRDAALQQAITNVGYK